jgi:hypothetical protein
MGCQADGLDVDDGAYCHLTKFHCQFLSTDPTYSYGEKRKTQSTTPIEVSLLE